ncbi:TonB-dependent receptor [Lysobacter sp. 2RAF19]
MRKRTGGWIAARRVLPLLAFALARVALAQDTAPAKTDANATPAELDRVIVTARRRAEDLQDVPIAVTSLDGNELRSRAAEDLSALSAATPNLVLYNARAFNSAVTATIRGVGQFDPVWGVEPAVAIYIDDVYLARPQAALLDILDVERIEVLRGPQGTLYGKNTIGGAIKYVTRPPEPYFSGSVQVTAGSYARLDGKALLNIPLGDTLRSRFAFGRYTRDGYGSNLVTGEDVSDRDASVMRATFDWLPAESVDVRLAWDRYRDRSHAMGARRMLTSPFPPYTPPDPGRFDVRSDAPNRDDTDAQGGALTVDWAIDATWHFKSVTARRTGDSFGYIDFDTLPLPLATLNRDFHDEQTSQEFQLQFNRGSAHAVAGLYWSDGEAAGAGYVSGRGQFGVSSGAVWTRTNALYADLTWDMTAHATAEIGMRYTREDKRAAVITRGTDASFLHTFGFRAYFNDATNFDAFSPRIALTWKPTDAAMYYVQATRGFKGGTYNIRADTVAVPSSALPLQDENATSLELGAKTQWREGRITLDAALFHTDYRDIQLSALVPFDSDGDGVDDDVFGDFRNAGQGTMQGVEIETSARVGASLRLLGHVAYLDTRYDEYISGGIDISDTARFPNAPEWTAGASAIGEWALAGGSSFDARLDVSFQGALYPTTDVNPNVLQPGHTVWNASLTWQSPAHDWEVALIGQNLSDKAYRTGSFWLPYLGLGTAYYGAPRTFALSITYSF